LSEKKSKPAYLVEIHGTKTNKKIVVYKPDKYSKEEPDFYEKYALGEVVFDSLREKKKIQSIEYKSPPEPNYKKTDSYYAPELRVKTQNHFFVINERTKF